MLLICPILYCVNFNNIRDRLYFRERLALDLTCHVPVNAHCTTCLPVVLFLFNVIQTQLPLGNFECDMNTKRVERESNIKQEVVSNSGPRTFTVIRAQGYDKKCQTMLVFEQFGYESNIALFPKSDDLSFSGRA